MYDDSAHATDAAAPDLDEIHPDEEGDLWVILDDEEASHPEVVPGMEDVGDSLPQAPPGGWLDQVEFDEASIGVAVGPDGVPVDRVAEPEPSAGRGSPVARLVLACAITWVLVIGVAHGVAWVTAEDEEAPVAATSPDVGPTSDARAPVATRSSTVREPDTGFEREYEVALETALSRVLP